MVISKFYKNRSVLRLINRKFSNKNGTGGFDYRKEIP